GGCAGRTGCSAPDQPGQRAGAGREHGVRAEPPDRDPQPGHHAQRRDPRARPEREAAGGHLAGIAHADPTHSSDPSEKNWCFHTGSRALMASTSLAHVSNAAARWSAATAATSAASPTLSVPIRWLAASARTPRASRATSARTSASVSWALGCAEYSARI